MSLVKFYDRDNVTVFCGDCLEVLPQEAKVEQLRLEVKR